MSRKTAPDAPPEVVVVNPEDEKAKGRAFKATLLAWVEADALWEGGEANTENRRPVYAVFAADEGAAAYFKANIRLGRRIDVPDGDSGATYRRGPKTAERWEFIKSGGYKVDEQRHPGVGTLLEVRMVDMLRLEGPGMVAKEGASFVMLPPREWCESQACDDAAALRHLKAIGCKVPAETLRGHFPFLAATSALFAAYLDRRVRGPFPADPRFYAQIMVAMISAGLAGLSVEEQHYGREQAWGCTPRLKFSEHGTERVGLLPGVAFSGAHDKIEPILAAEVQRYLRVVRR